MRKYKTVRKSWKLLWFLCIIYVLGMSVEPVFSKLIMDSIESGLKTGIDLNNLIYLISGWFIMSVCIMSGRYLYGYVLLTKNSDDWARSIIHDIREMTLLPTKYHISIQNGEKIKLIDRGAEAVWETGDIFLLEIVPYLLFSIILISIGLFIHTPLTLIALIFLPLSIWLTRYFGKIAHTQQHEANIYWDKLFWRVSDIFTNIQVLKISAREEHESKYIYTLYDRANKKQMKIRWYWLRFSSFWRIIKIIPRILVLGYSVFLYSHWEISLGTIFFFFSFTDTIYSPIFSILQNYQQLMQSFAKYEQLQDTLKLPKEKNNGKKELKHIEKSISLQNLSFAYPSTTREVLTDINLEIKKWSRIALVGHTGSGKSTIIQLLMRFYEPSKGHITIDGTDIYDFTLESYRRRFAAVFQDTTLFNETIRHNLEYVRDGITEKDLRKAAKEANILDFIESLPEKWETEVGERWLKLSGGEKQRLAIARAILADPEILILDEATSALDTRTERLVQEAFDHLMKWRTSIIIAHRLSTIMSADTIYLLEKGRIIASGSHTELYEKSWEYREMVDLQHDGFVGEGDVEADLDKQ